MHWIQRDDADEIRKRISDNRKGKPGSFGTLGKTWKVENRKKAPCPEDCQCKRHSMRNSGQFKEGGEAGPGWKAQAAHGWTEAQRSKSKRFTGGHHSEDAKARIAEASRVRQGNSTGVTQHPDPYPPEYAPARLRVFKRDDYACTICGKRGVLHAHHLNYDKQDCRDSNLATLCGSCHMRHHRSGAWPIHLGTITA